MSMEFLLGLRVLQMTQKHNDIIRELVVLKPK